MRFEKEPISPKRELEEEELLKLSSSIEKKNEAMEKEEEEEEEEEEELGGEHEKKSEGEQIGKYAEGSEFLQISKAEGIKLNSACLRVDNLASLALWLLCLKGVRELLGLNPELEGEKKKEEKKNKNRNYIG